MTYTIGACPGKLGWTGFVARDGERIVEQYAFDSELQALRTVEHYREAWSGEGCRHRFVVINVNAFDDDREEPPSYTLFDKQLEDEAIRDELH